MTNDELWIRFAQPILVFGIQLKYCIKPAFLETGHTLNAFFLIDPGNLFLFPDNGISRAAAKTNSAFGAYIRINFKLQQCYAALGRTSFFIYVSLIFVPEVAQRGQHRMWVP